ncbi:tRNA (adenosine(37)-N6)-dimethylallyltransferase MiaA [Myxococcota bacterium]|nr:tRNA (adenosine(37)-N6)-dimethylallyltransferase MiaA [Myxococcota bacterium]MBU1432388.1 tRNA (adenosine(37)-N6)-dimethylallyltransferase MiaA [Myxococcota bacterium]MBU1897054.1 tRNA (adenosine(37)-N6)-dimethylallyltransferase MiaA [Myxococcota bacterium]
MSALLCVVGPTASGKTRLAVDLCRRWGGEIVGVDASQIYRGMDIGTGKATPEELGGVRHHLIDVVAPDAPFDANAFVERADAAIADIHRRGKRAILCGGTGLYLRALLEGLSAAPPISEMIRAQLRARQEAGEPLHDALRRVDPEAAARIAPADAQRVERALGVYLTTGRCLTSWHAAQRHELRYPAVIVGLRWPRAQLNARITRRVDQMLNGGLPEEIAALLRAGYGPDLKSMSALGYRDLMTAARGGMSMAEARQRMIIATRQYAKRQMTWFQKTPGLIWLEPPFEAEALDGLLSARWGAP